MGGLTFSVIMARGKFTSKNISGFPKKKTDSLEVRECAWLSYSSSPPFIHDFFRKIFTEILQLFEPVRHAPTRTIQEKSPKTPAPPPILTVRYQKIVIDG
jgi:hypothetical protein